MSPGQRDHEALNGPRTGETRVSAGRRLANGRTRVSNAARNARTWARHPVSAARMRASRRAEEARPPYYGRSRGGESDALRYPEGHPNAGRPPGPLADRFRAAGIRVTRENPDRGRAGRTPR
jgi:hypothetical protein